MSVTILAVAAQLAVSSVVLDAPDLQHFPGSYFDSTGKNALQRRVMETWPGPTGLTELWNSPEIRGGDRVAILLGGAAFHDPSLLPIYQDGIKRRWEPIRQAAIYGFRDLIGDRPPNVAGKMSDWDIRRLVFEMESVRRTLLREPLVAMWLQSLLRSEKKPLPGYRGYTLPRHPRDCLLSIEKIMTLDDLPLLVLAYQVSEDRTTRIGLVKLIESLTLGRFIVKPKGTSSGWGPEVFETGMAKLDGEIERWTSWRCRIGVNWIVATRMAEMGAQISDPRSAEACHVWLNVIRFGDPGWWPTAAKQLYQCGGPWIELSVLWSESETNEARRNQLLNWYSPQHKGPNRSQGPPNLPIVESEGGP